MFERRNQHIDTLQIMADFHNISVKEYQDYIDHADHDLHHPAVKKVLSKYMKRNNDA